jgi:hypothetical protein
LTSQAMGYENKWEMYIPCTGSDEIMLRVNRKSKMENK